MTKPQFPNMQKKEEKWRRRGREENIWISKICFFAEEKKNGKGIVGKCLEKEDSESKLYRKMLRQNLGQVFKAELWLKH